MSHLVSCIAQDLSDGNQLTQYSTEMLELTVLCITSGLQSHEVHLGTCRDNILFGKPLQQERYTAVLEACALQQDIANMSHADETVIGDRGATLSGGQRARLSLARAMYQVLLYSSKLLCMAWLHCTCYALQQCAVLVMS